MASTSRSVIRVGTLFTLYGRRAGAELCIENIIAGVARTQPDVTMVVYCNAEAAPLLPDDAPRVEKRVVPALASQFKKAAWLEWQAGKALQRDRVNVFWIPSGTNHFPGPWSVPAVVTFHDFGEYFVKYKYDWIRTQYRKRICVPRSIRRAAVFTCVSQSVAGDLKQLFEAAQPCHVIYNGPSPHDRQSVARSPVTPEEEAALASLPRYFLYVGRTDYRGKGLDVLVRAYLSYRQAHPDSAALVLAGPQGMQHERLLRDIEQHGLQETVRYIGRVSDEALDRLYAGCQAVVFCTRYEGFGFPALEAMQHGAPLICARVAALAEIAGDAALFFDPENADELRRRLEETDTQPDTRTQLVEHAQQRLAAFDWTRTYDQMADVFRTAAKR